MLPFILGARDTVVFLIWKEFRGVFFNIACINTRNEIIEIFGVNFDCRDAVSRSRGK